MLGHLVGYVGFHGRPFLGEKKPSTETFCVEGFFLGRFGPMLGLCWTMLHNKNMDMISEPGCLGNFLVVYVRAGMLS